MEKELRELEKQVRLYAMLKGRLIIVYDVPENELDDKGAVSRAAKQMTGLTKMEEEKQVKFLERMLDALF